MTGWWRREVVTKGSGDEGKWWRRGRCRFWYRGEVVTKGSGDEGKWWRREVVTKGSGDEGKWWWRGMVRKGGGDDGKWWGREVVRKGSGRREVVTMGSGDDGKWWGREVVSWGGSWSTKPCCFPCKVAAGDDERYLVCAAVAAAVVPDAIGSFYVFCNNGCSCVRSSIISWSCGCRSHCNGCVNVAWAMFWGGSRSTKPCVFPCKVAAGDDERYLVCAAVAAAVVPDAIGSFYVFCNNGCSCVRSSMRFLKLWLQIAL